MTILWEEGGGFTCAEIKTKKQKNINRNANTKRLQDVRAGSVSR